MDTEIKNLVLMIALLVTLTGNVAHAQDSEMSLGMYVVVSGLEESKLFYTVLFGAPPSFESETFAAFSVSGGLFGIYEEDAFEHELVRGNNTVPYFRVNDIQAEFTRVRSIASEMVHSQLVVEPGIQLFMFKDADGNAIEFFSINSMQ